MGVLKSPVILVRLRSGNFQRSWSYPLPYLFSVTAGVPPAVEPGILRIVARVSFRVSYLTLAKSGAKDTRTVDKLPLSS